MRDMMYKYTSLTQVDRCAILKKEPKGSRQEGKDGAWLLPSSQKGVIIMTDFEMLSLVIMILMLLITTITVFKNK